MSKSSTDFLSLMMIFPTLHLFFLLNSIYFVNCDKGGPNIIVLGAGGGSPAGGSMMSGSNMMGHSSGGTSFGNSFGSNGNNHNNQQTGSSYQTAASSPSGNIMSAGALGTGSPNILVLGESGGRKSDKSKSNVIIIMQPPQPQVQQQQQQQAPTQQFMPSPSQFSNTMFQSPPPQPMYPSSYNSPSSFDPPSFNPSSMMSALASSGLTRRSFAPGIMPQSSEDAAFFKWMQSVYPAFKGMMSSGSSSVPMMSLFKSAPSYLSYPWLSGSDRTSFSPFTGTSSSPSVSGGDSMTSSSDLSDLLAPYTFK